MHLDNMKELEWILQQSSKAFKKIEPKTTFIDNGKQKKIDAFPF